MSWVLIVATYIVKWVIKVVTKLTVRLVSFPVSKNTVR